MNLKKNDPMISAIVPIYNGSDYLRKTLQSIVNIDYKNLEIILVNDGSSDDSLSIIENFIQENPSKKIVMYNQSNKGLMKALNKGIELSDGKYIMVLGQDDIVKKEHLRVLVDHIESLKKDIGLAFVNAKYLVNESMTEEYIRKKKSLNNINTLDSKKVFLKLSKWNFIVSTGILINSRVIKDLGGFEEKYINRGEWITWLKISKTSPITYCNKVNSYYRIHDNNITNSMFTSVGIKKQILYTLNVQKYAYSISTNKISSMNILIKSFLKNIIYYFYKKYFSQKSNSRERLKKRGIK